MVCAVQPLHPLPVTVVVALPMPPTAAIGLASTYELPNATAASIEVELVIMPQPRSTSVVPPTLMPVVAVLTRLTTQ